MNSTYLRLFIRFLLVTFFLVPAFAFAQTASTTIGTPVSGAAATTARSRADTEITRRITALNDLNTRIQTMTRVTSSFKQTLNSNVENQVQLLTALQTKIDADTSLATLKTDIKSITQSYRIYVLVLPQGRISAMADRVANLTAMMQGIGIKLQARLQSLASAGNNVTAGTAALNDLGAKLTDAQTQAQASLSLIGPLSPDNGSSTAMTANTKALQQARSDLGVAQQDLIAGRKDIATLLKIVLTGNTASSTTTTSASTVQ